MIQCDSTYDAYFLLVVVFCILRHGKEGKVAKLMVRRSSKDQGVLDVRICILGDAESGKSTLLGVFTTGKLDNGSVYISRHFNQLKSDLPL